MTAKAAPTADAITLSETLTLLESDFATFVKAVGEKRFALWVGSGISLSRAPSVGKLLGIVIEHLRAHITSQDDKDKFYVALLEVLAIAGLDQAGVAALPLDDPFDDWPSATSVPIIDALWLKYATVLDVRVDGEKDDYLLWNAVDVRKEYGHLADPDCEHLSIAILVLEGAVSEIASANWDGLIEVAIEELAPNGRSGVLQVVVNPADVRDAAAIARLIKFHGCAVLCVKDDVAFRRFLIATQPQITNWPNEGKLAALRTEVQSVATTLNSIFVGLSLQDDNIQDIFSKVRQALPLTWPCAPGPQHCVFCEDKIGASQDNMLRVGYGDAYGPHSKDIKKASLLRAFAKPALMALAIQIVLGKLSALLDKETKAKFTDSELAQLQSALFDLKNVIAAEAPTNKADFAPFLRKVIFQWSRGLSLYRTGNGIDATSKQYDALTPLPTPQMLNDKNVEAMNFGIAALSLALLGLRRKNAGMTFGGAGDLVGKEGAFQATGDWGAKKPAQVILVQNIKSYLELVAKGAFDGDNMVVLHSDDTLDKLGAKTSARSPFGAGVSGRNRVRQVSMSKLLESAKTLAELEQRFVEEVTI